VTASASDNVGVGGVQCAASRILTPGARVRSKREKTARGRRIRRPPNYGFYRRCDARMPAPVYGVGNSLPHICSSLGAGSGPLVELFSL
jgi:hypothetical protein